jgi:hypothetical protein
VVNGFVSGTAPDKEGDFVRCDFGKGNRARAYFGYATVVVIDEAIDEFRCGLIGIVE